MITANKQLLENLLRLANNTRAEVVLTSAWRLPADTLSAMISVLFESGIRLGGCTPDLGVGGQGDRVDEIMSWLSSVEAANVARWIALDSDDLLRMNKLMHRSHFVRTNYSLGLDDATVVEATQVLRAQPGGSSNKIKRRICVVLGYTVLIACVGIL